MEWSFNRARFGAILGSLGLCLFLMGGPSQAAPAENSASAAVPGGTRFAIVWRLRGDVTAAPSNGSNPRKLREGDPVFVGERVRAAAQA